MPKTTRLSESEHVRNILSLSTLLVTGHLSVGIKVVVSVKMSTYVTAHLIVVQDDRVQTSAPGVFRARRLGKGRLHRVRNALLTILIM